MAAARRFNCKLTMVKKKHNLNNVYYGVSQRRFILQSTSHDAVLFANNGDITPRYPSVDLGCIPKRTDNFYTHRKG